MTKAGRRMLKAAREAVKFSRLLDRFDMEDKAGHTTIFITKKGRVLGTVHGSRPRQRP